MLIDKWKILTIAGISFLLVCVFFLNIKPNEFLFSHDEYLSVNYFESLNGLFIRSFQDFNVDNTTILTVTLLDRLYYFFGFSLGIKLQILQRVLYFAKLFLSILLPYIGFTKFSQLIFKEDSKKNDYIVWLITFLYAFNTYTTIYWHGNAFQLSLMLCYSFAPLALYYFDVIINNRNLKFSLLIKEALILLAMSFGIYLFAVFIIIALVYYVANAALSRRTTKTSILNLAKLMLISAPLYAIFLPMILVIIFGSGTVNATGGETFTNLQGGFLYPLFLWFSWGIYNDWSPKNIFTFNHYYQGILYLLSPLAIYLTIFWGIKRRFNNKYAIYFLLILLVSLIFVKGSQPPFEDIYIQLLKHFPPFRVFRSPDNKFGFAIVFSLCFLLLSVSKNIKKNIFIAVMIFVVVVQAYPLISGIAIKGQNTSISSDRVIHIPQNYYDLADIVNNAGENSEYILPVPPANFSHFIISPTEKHLGQDLIPKITRNPFTTPDEYSSMSLDTYKKVQASIENNLVGIEEFPIEYFLVRKDLEFITSETNLNLDQNKNVEKIYENNSFALYKNLKFVRIVEAQNINVASFQTISPVEYKVHIDGLKDNTQLILNNNFNHEWKVYIEKPNSSKLVSSENNVYKDYANSWQLNKTKITDTFDESYYKKNPDGTINADFIIYFKPQTDFYILAAITIIFAVIYTSVILIRHDK